MLHFHRGRTSDGRRAEEEMHINAMNGKVEKIKND